ncbi:hypothetical protein V8G54_036318 [Vigna mungo]|uniref:Uncharacterized protein n=1 Tax=Vigna mungo TaxID=3915 RepID=A0AAQ3MGK4_VIGMU
MTYVDENENDAAYYCTLSLLLFDMLLKRFDEICSSFLFNFLGDTASFSSTKSRNVWMRAERELSRFEGPAFIGDFLLNWCSIDKKYIKSATKHVIPHIRNRPLKLFN